MKRQTADEKVFTLAEMQDSRTYWEGVRERDAKTICEQATTIACFRQLVKRLVVTAGVSLWLLLGLIGAGFSQPYDLAKVTTHLEGRRQLAANVGLLPLAGPLGFFVGLGRSGFGYYGWSLSATPQVELVTAPPCFEDEVAYWHAKSQTFRCTDPSLVLGTPSATGTNTIEFHRGQIVPGVR